MGREGNFPITRLHNSGVARLRKGKLMQKLAVGDIGRDSEGPHHSESMLCGRMQVHWAQDVFLAWEARNLNFGKSEGTVTSSHSQKLSVNRATPRMVCNPNDQAQDTGNRVPALTLLSTV